MVIRSGFREVIKCGGLLCDEKVDIRVKNAENPMQRDTKPEKGEKLLKNVSPWEEWSKNC
jgi:hypothetical protein